MKAADHLTVNIFNVGAGDHIMIEFPDGALGIIDSFYQGSHLELQEIPALSYLRYLRCKRFKENDSSPIIISFLCISHADLDHLTGLDMLIDFIENKENNVSLENLWLFGGLDIDEYMTEALKILAGSLNRFEDETKEKLRVRISNYKARLTRLNQFRNNWRKASKRTERYFDDVKELGLYGKSCGYQVHSLGPVARLVKDYSQFGFRNFFCFLLEGVQELDDADFEKMDFSCSGKINRNNVSSILGLRFGNYNLIFGGDATREIWEASLSDILQRDEKKLLHPDFLKASHHGSKHSSSASLWNDLFEVEKKKLYVGISAGKRHLHPNDEFYVELSGCCTGKEITAEFFRTNECRECCSTVAHRNMDWYLAAKDILAGNNNAKVNEALYNELPDIRKTTRSHAVVPNLLALIFEFPVNGKNADIKVYRGVSGGIGSYSECLLEKSKCFCDWGKSSG